VDVDLNGRKAKGGAEIWPIGTHSMKVETMAALNLTLQGQDEHGAFPPGAMIFSKKRGVEFFEQITAEHLVDDDNGKRRWMKRVKGSANEGLDIAVGCRALAYHVGAGWMDDAAWQQLLADRQAPPPEGERDLFSAALAAPPVGEAPSEPMPAAPAPVPDPAPPPPPTANGVRLSISSLLA
jgi:phage terminase large subunit GpA-like protein